MVVTDGDAFTLLPVVASKPVAGDQAKVEPAMLADALKFTVPPAQNVVGPPAVIFATYDEQPTAAKKSPNEEVLFSAVPVMEFTSVV